MSRWYDDAYYHDDDYTTQEELQAIAAVAEGAAFGIPFSRAAPPRSYAAEFAGYSNESKARLFDFHESANISADVEYMLAHDMHPPPPPLAPQATTPPSGDPRTFIRAPNAAMTMREAAEQGMREGRGGEVS